LCKIIQVETLTLPLPSFTSFLFLPYPLLAARSHISPVDLPASTVMQGITLSDLAAVPPQERKQFLGEHLYTRIRNIDPLSQDADLAGKITGMLLEMDNTDLLHLLESQDALRDKAQEAIDVLGAHEQQKSAATPISTAKFSAVVRNHPALQGMQVVSYVYFTLHLTYV